MFADGLKANAGDSRSVLGVKGRAKPLSFDHKPQNEGKCIFLLQSSLETPKLKQRSGEKARICAAGGFVDFGRVNGNLALSRAIGDFEFKKSAELSPEQQIVTAFPDVVTHSISNDDEFLVIACDGMFVDLNLPGCADVALCRHMGLSVFASCCRVRQTGYCRQTTAVKNLRKHDGQLFGCE